MDSATARGMTKLGCCGYFGKGGARGHGFRDCAGNDEVGVLRVLRERWGQGAWIPRLRSGMTKLGFCAYFGNDGRGRNNGGMSGDGETVALLTPPSAFAHTVAAHNTVVRSRTHRCPTNTVILREVAVSMVACRGRWLLWLKHWQGMGGAGDGFRDCARTQRWNDEVGVLRQGKILREFGNDGRGRNNGGMSGDGETVARLTPPFAFAHTVAAHNTVVLSRTHRCPTNTVILREVAVSMVACRGRWLLWLKHWQGKMDSATARGMTKLGCCGYFGNNGGRGRWIPRLRRE